MQQLLGAQDATGHWFERLERYFEHIECMGR